MFKFGTKNAEIEYMRQALLVSAEEYFRQTVRKAVQERRMIVPPNVENYLVQLLGHYLNVQNLFECRFNEDGTENPQTLAEIYLHACQADAVRRLSLLKKLGDRSLYVCGFFGDSLERKAIDQDYYIKMGEVAYGTLAEHVRENREASVYRTIANGFVNFVDVLTVISHESMTRSNQSILQLYDKYVRTGSLAARDKLLELGVLSLPQTPQNPTISKPGSGKQ